MPSSTDIREEHRRGFEELNAFWNELEKTEASVVAQQESAPGFVSEQMDRVLDRIRAFEPTISIIGQIKAGKSTLLNAMIGETDLLPSDVNPWTSVITGLHLNSRIRPENTRALFQFFDAEEWDRLVETGGRLGEMAARAGFDTEVEEVREQVKQMRQSTEERLGDEFQKLLGKTRAFPEIDKDTLDRYICYGDPDDLEEGASEGVYADLTKLADLYIDLPDYPTGLCFRDTPGVNDTFMMREQITLNAIAESRMCIVVLSAHQALSTMDLALMRIICSVESREVLIFVNRIDELENPAKDTAAIERDIRWTLGRMGLGEELPILFGSGYWANCALDDRCDKMMPMSRASLESLFPEQDMTDPAVLRASAMEASGIGALHRAVASLIVKGPGKALMADVVSELAQVSEMRDTVIKMSGKGALSGRLASTEEIRVKLADLRKAALNGFDRKAKSERDQLQDRLERAREQFIDTAIDALQSHIDAFGEVDNWSHEPSSLRMMMRSAYTHATTRLRRGGERSLEEIADGIHDILHYDLNVFHDTMSLEFPQQPQHKPPTALAKTLSLDLQGSWWRRFWRLGGKNRAEKRYRGLIEAEIAPVIEEVLSGHFDEAVQNSSLIVENFFSDQSRFVEAILECTVDGEAGKDSSKNSKKVRSAA